ncbi:hypothetical protein KY290_020273 [Solanum tuberosum]|uniref:Uncharacterized protein n=1 Tax=Solanum tuberosum TaxID=4113 RepID=A0ABQ7UY73_SOLTU|nr:hypothetical protein KY290_020273 [Solanum tuberosum]
MGLLILVLGERLWWLLICRASPEFMVIVHRSWSQKHIYNRRKRKRGKGRGLAAKLKGRGLAAKRKKGKGRGLAAFALRWSSWIEQNPTLKMKINKIEQKWVILFGGSGRVGSG